MKMRQSRNTNQIRLLLLLSSFFQWSYSFLIPTPMQRHLHSLKILSRHSLRSVTVENEAWANQNQGKQNVHSRGKVNEMDFCLSPSDVSLSRSYGNVRIENTNTALSQNDTPRLVSLTRALNSVSNRAVRRILLSRSWPSPEALNISLRQVLSDRKTKSLALEEEGVLETKNDDASTVKCPVPRPILNIIMRRSQEYNDGGQLLPSPTAKVENPEETVGKKQRKTDQEWIKEQIEAFRLNYGQVPGYYEYADAYLECILDLATTGIESDRASEILSTGVYDDSYRRFLSTIKSVGVVFEAVTCPDGKERMKIAAKLTDQDICLSIMDKIAKRNEKNPDNKTLMNQNKVPVEIERAQSSTELNYNQNSTQVLNATIDDSNTLKATLNVRSRPLKRIKGFFNFIPLMMPRETGKSSTAPVGDTSNINLDDSVILDKDGNKEEAEAESIINPEDLGAMLLSAEEPTVTRQLNILANVVKRALLFGGDDEILVLSETMEADKLAFIKRWYKDTIQTTDTQVNVDPKVESRPGVQFYNCLTQLLRDCYTNGSVSDLNPPFDLSPGYMNAYERLTGTLVELGSGYIKPANSKNVLNALPKSPRDELTRFSQWEANLRKIKPEMSDYPDDLVGTWQVKDELGGKTLGTSTVVFKTEGEVYVEPPLKGLRWRLDPGPTHLDTCTWQVLSHDGAVLQYRGFIDRGARLEARFSKRPINIRGSVTFQMRDGGDIVSINDNYKRDMLPIIARTGTTRFVMSKVFDLSDDLVK